MKKEIQVILLFAIAVCIFQFSQLYKEPERSIHRHLFSGIANWQMPVDQGINYSFPKSNEITDPFSTRFFENASLKGFVKNNKNEWCAIFTSPGCPGQILEPGLTVNGLTLLGANGKYCRVKFGSVVREFRL